MDRCTLRNRRSGGNAPDSWTRIATWTAVSLTCFALVQPDAAAEWSCDDPLASTLVSDQPSYFVISQWPGGAVPDGVGGVFVTWEENAQGDLPRCRVQRLDGNGNRVWSDEGIPIVDLTDQHTPDLVEDGSGGIYAMVASSPTPESDFEVRLQHFSASGERLWGPEGIVVFQACGAYSYRPELVPDGEGGLFFLAVTSGAPEQVSMQRIAASGNLLWGDTCGRVVATAAETLFNAAVIPDGSGGAFLSYDEFAGNGTNGLNVKAQRLDANGDPLWTPGGVMVCSLPEDQFATPPIPDGEGGVLLVWYSRGTIDDYVGGQRLDGNGNALWSFNGQQLLPLGYYLTEAMTDGEGGFWLSVWRWGDDVERDNHLQRFANDGTPVFADIVPITEAPGRQYGAEIFPDGSGGCHLVWPDWRNGGAMEQDIYYQHVTEDGIVLEQLDGAPVTTEPDWQGVNGVIAAADGSGQLFVTWTNDSPVQGMFAERVPCTDPADVVPVAPGARPLRIYPNPIFAPDGSHPVQIDLRVGERPETEPSVLDVFDARGRRVRQLTAPAGSGVVPWDGTDELGRALPSGVYRVRGGRGDDLQRGSVIVLR